MSDDKHEGTPGVRHVFDGIEELDNNLPNWWLGLLWGTVLFAFGYWFYYQSAQLGPDQLEAYTEERAAWESKTRALAAAAPSGPAALAQLASDPKAVEAGHEVFKQNCASCHGMEAQGLVGPNLTDKFWLHGGKPDEIKAIIAAGKLDKGMPAWEPVLGPDRVQKVTAYVVSLKGRNLAGKEPQGQPVE